MTHLLGEARKLLGLRMLLRGQDCLRVVGILFTLFQLRPQHQRKQVIEGKRGVEVRSSCYLSVGMLYRVLRLLAARVSFRTLRLELVLL